jgi:large subunit ribosomal protein L3
MSTALMGKKVGMTRVFTDDGRSVPVTLVEVGPCFVVQRKTTDRDGYDAVQLGFGARREKTCTKPQLGHFKKASIEPCRWLREFRVAADAEYKTGDVLKADLFQPGDRVDVTGSSKGKGFQGVIKRHGHGGGPGGHGSHFHRAPGSIGQCADPAKVFKGVKLPGQMGNKRITTQNLEIVSVDPEKNLVAVKGCLPGAAGGMVVLKKSVKGAQ